MRGVFGGPGGVEASTVKLAAAARFDDAQLLDG
jgi:hypothetical protein